MKNTRKIRINPAKLHIFRLPEDPFTSLAHSIISQQISTSAARSILARFVKLYPKGALTPKRTLVLAPDKMRSAGLSNQKVVYMKDLAAKFLDGTIDPKLFPTMSDEEIIEHLITVKGVGVWTAHMFLIGTLHRPDVLPVGDLAIKKGFQKVFNLRSMPTDKRMHALAKPYAGKRTLLSHHLWNSLEG